VVERAARGLLDTSAYIRLTGSNDRTAFPTETLISTITLAELAVGPLTAATAEERSARQAQVQSAEADLEPLAFDVAAARAFGGVASSMRRVGRKPTARSFDALIAAIAIANGLPLYTANPRDFEGIDGLTVIALPPVADNDGDVESDVGASSSSSSSDS
jgi:tRNA(fMet)-specific endonuclease VapC